MNKSAAFARYQGMHNTRVWLSVKGGNLLTGATAGGVYTALHKARSWMSNAVSRGAAGATKPCQLYLHALLARATVWLSVKGGNLLTGVTADSVGLGHK